MTKRNPACLVVVTAQRYSAEYGEAALQSARSRGEDVVVALVLDPEVPEAVAGHLAEAGFLGERLMHELRATMARELEERGREHLAELTLRAAELGLGVNARTAKGPFVESIRDAADTLHVSRVLAAQTSTSPVARVLFGSETRRLQRLLACPLERYDLDGNLLPSDERGAGDRSS